LFVDFQSQRVCRFLCLGFGLVLADRANYRFAVAFGSVDLHLIPAKDPNRFAGLAFDSLQTSFLMSCTPHISLPSDGEHGWPTYSVDQAGVHNQKILCEKVGAFSLQVPLQSNPQALSSGIAITCPHECRESGRIVRISGEFLDECR
jgi:hypothetical protein